MVDLSQEVMTVDGAVPASELGIVASRETVLYGLPGWQDDPGTDFDPPAVYQAIQDRLAAFRAAGGTTLVDGRGGMRSQNARLFADLARSTGVRIVVSTGLGRESEIPGHFRQSFDETGIRRPNGETSQGPDGWIPTVESLADILQGEITQGIAADGMMRASSRAGLIRTACSRETITALEELAIRGAALAARRTGAAVVAGGVFQAHPQLDILVDTGLGEDRIVIGHCDNGLALDAARDREFAGRGAYVAYDHVGWEGDAAPHAIDDSQRAEIVKSMVDAGFAERLILSCGAIGHAIGGTGTSHGFAHLLESFVPLLEKAGVGESTIHTILVENPARLLSLRITY